MNKERDGTRGRIMMCKGCNGGCNGGRSRENEGAGFAWCDGLIFCCVKGSSIINGGVGTGQTHGGLGIRTTGPEARSHVPQKKSKKEKIKKKKPGKEILRL